MRTTFFCVGAQKAGTTWLYDVLNHHPEIGFPPMKELHFWRDLDTGGRFREVWTAMERHPERLKRVLQIETEADYLAYLEESAGDRPVSGDLSPDNAMLPAELFSRMEAAVPDGRFLFVMRDPVDRHWSWIRMRANRRGRDPLLVLRNQLDVFATQGFTGKRADYGGTLTALRQAGLANLRIMLFEDLMADQSGHIKDLLGYLGVAPEINPAMVEAMGRTSRKGVEAELPPRQAEQLRQALDRVYREVADHGIDARHCWRY